MTARASWRTAALGGFIAAAAATAQPAGDLRECAAIEAEDERLACYDRAVGSAAPAPAEPGSESPGSENEPAEAAARAPRAARQEAEAETDPEPESADDDGAWVTVVSVRENLSGLAVFTTADGRTFEQTSTRPAQYGPVPFRAHLEPGLLGGYFLREEGARRRVRVSERN